MEHIYRDDALFGPEQWFKAQRLFRWMVQAAPANSCFVEIGAYKGRSAAYLAVEMANAGKNLRLVTIDPFLEPDTETICRRNLAPFADWVTVLTDASPAAARHFADASLQFVFIDGDHSFRAVRADIAAWRRKIAPGGVIAGDDFWKREPDVGLPSRGGAPFPVWSAVEAVFGGWYDLMVRDGRGILVEEAVTMGIVADTIRDKLTRAFAPTALTVVDDSHRHAGHAGARPGGETHFKVAIASAAFAARSRVERQRMVYAILADELAGPVHALELRTTTPDETPAA